MQLYSNITKNNLRKWIWNCHVENIGHILREWYTTLNTMLLQTLWCIMSGQMAITFQAMSPNGFYWIRPWYFDLNVTYVYIGGSNWQWVNIALDKRVLTLNRWYAINWTKVEQVTLFHFGALGHNGSKDQRNPIISSVVNPWLNTFINLFGTFVPGFHDKLSLRSGFHGDQIHTNRMTPVTLSRG